jgi:hypothetical protein
MSNTEDQNKVNEDKANKIVEELIGLSHYRARTILEMVKDKLDLELVLQKPKDEK